ncbi:Thrombomodulin [Trema orientale]|uniref:Thrombomodulin n=1 Tax=Trema orientale TaxID=63057 RepID=A0A2P5FTE7_TREOI|nr:Thrombomodulin [Trema orientale]
MDLHILLGVILLLTLFTDTANSSQLALPGCRDRCGDLKIPYPFGIGDNCYLEEAFNVTCDDSASPSIAFLGTSNLNITKISLHNGELEVLQSVAKDCNDGQGNNNVAADFWLSDFTISATKNKFTAIGCDTYAILEGYRDGQSYTTGCTSLCDRKEDVNFGSCSGAGCCQITSIPSGLRNITVWLSSYYNHSKVRSFSPCSYAVLAEERKFKFSETSFEHFEDIKEFPMVLDWAVGNLSCEQARRRGNLACAQNSKCVNSNSSSGYLCRCLPGYDGNPYHPDGCQDIDECIKSNPCINGICKNIPGGFKCSCRKGYALDGGTNICTKVNSSTKETRHLFLHIIFGKCVLYILSDLLI